MGGGKVKVSKVAEVTKVAIVVMSFVSAVNCQLLEDTRRLLQLQGLQGPSQSVQESAVPQEVPSAVAPQQQRMFESVPLLQPAQQSAATSSAQQESGFEFKELPQKSDEVVLPSDVLVIRTAKMNYIVGVDQSGYADLPNVGVRQVSGQRVSKIEEMIFNATGEQPKIDVITSPRLSLTIQSAVPQYVSLLGDFMRPTISPPGNLGFCIGNAMGLNSTASGKLLIYTRGKVEKLDFNYIIRHQPEKLNIYLEPGTVVYAEKSSGWLSLENVGNVFSRLRDIALTVIAWIELDNYGRQRGWW
jgi:protein involved in polysaccharide export with SLBB domain